MQWYRRGHNEHDWKSCGGHKPPEGSNPSHCATAKALSRNGFRAFVLSVAVLSILITAPLGAIGMDLTYRKLLQQQE